MMLKLVKSYKARRSFFGGAAILFRKEVEAGALLLAHRSCAGPDVRQHRQRQTQHKVEFFTMYGFIVLAAYTVLMVLVTHRPI